MTCEYCGYSDLHDAEVCRERLRGRVLSLTEQRDALRTALSDQSRATDPRCGLVQPVTVKEAEALNVAVRKARAVLALCPPKDHLTKGE